MICQVIRKNNNIFRFVSDEKQKKPRTVKSSQSLGRISLFGTVSGFNKIVEFGLIKYGFIFVEGSELSTAYF